MEKDAFLNMISRINAVFDDAERIGCRSCLEGTCAWLSLFTIHLCTRTNYEKCLDRISDYVRERNANLFNRVGVTMIDPMERGLRVIEFVIDDFN